MFTLNVDLFFSIPLPGYVKDVLDQKYEYGFTTDVHTEIIEKGLNEDVVRLISQKKGDRKSVV